MLLVCEFCVEQCASRYLVGLIYAEIRTHINASVKIEGIIRGGVQEAVEVEVLQYICVFQSAEVEIKTLIRCGKVTELITLTKICMLHLLCVHLHVWWRLLSSGLHASLSLSSIAHDTWIVGCDWR